MRYIDNKPMGTNVKKLVHMTMAKIAVGSGGGMNAAVDLFTTPGRLQEVLRQAVNFVDDALDAVKAAPDSHYTDEDDERIAYQIIRGVEKRRDSTLRGQ